MVDETKLNAFIGRMLGDLGGALSVPLVRIGDRLGLYKALHEAGPLTPGELATKAGIAERYAREWLSHQAASGYLEYNSGTARFTLPPEQAMIFADPDSPVYMQGGFDIAAVMMENQALVEPAFRSGTGVGWGDQAQCLFCASGRFFRPGYHNNLVQAWLPALDGVTAKLARGAFVADVGCGHGFSTIMMAKAFPQSTFVGYDFHPGSVAQAQIHAEQHGVTANTRFDVATASEFPGEDLDLVTFFDCLHDMGDPVGAARHVRQALKPDGTLTGFYADEAVLRVIDQMHPPNDPQEIDGREAIAACYDDVCGRTMTHSVDFGIAEGDRLAFLQSCTYPDGKRVCCSATLALQNGKIVRQVAVQAWDA